nr:hypothetical protein [Gemmatimonadaceae bacterium]
FERWRACGALHVLLPALSATPAWAFAACDHVARPDDATRAERAELRYLVRLALPLLPFDRHTATQALRALRCSNHEITVVAGIVDTWRQHGAALASAARGPIAGATSRRLAAALGRTRAAAMLRACDAAWRAMRAAGMDAPDEVAARRLSHRVLRSAWREPIALADLAVGGDDLRAAGVPAGPQLGATLQRLLAAVLEEPARNTREVLLALAMTPPGS